MDSAPIIRNASDLPGWFDIAKYRPARQLNSVGWYEQFLLREECLYYVTEGLIKKRVTGLLELLYDDPLIGLSTDTPLLWVFGGGKLAAFKSPDRAASASLRGIHLITVRELFWIERKMRKGRRLYANKFADQVFEDDDGPFVFKVKQWIDRPVYDSIAARWELSEKAAIVNLNLPDRILLDQFKQFLAEHRAKSKPKGITPRARESTYQDWINYGVLPYLDLLLWSKVKRVRIPNRVFADAIFPEGTGGEEVVRKTTAPLAMHAISKHNLEILEARAAGELAEKIGRDKVPES
jgi:hypothetical protein